MKSRDFCFWLQGYFELTGIGELSGYQVEIVKKHLSLVFKHEIDPAAGNSKIQSELDKIHNPSGLEGIIARC
jgi:hypothetical protein